MNLILLQSNEVDSDGLCHLSGSRAKHVREVLRAAPGKPLRIGLLNGPFGEGVVEQVDAERVVLRCTFETAPPPRPRIDLLLAMPRPKVMKRLWAQLAALGVGRIILLRVDKVERYYFDSHVIDPEFYTPLLIEGLQQARCTHLPEVMIRPRFKPFVEDELNALFPDHFKLLADPSGQNRLGDFLPLNDSSKRVVLAIGPEGGWTPYELEQLTARGFNLFGMGDRILRSDTATIGLISVLADRMAEGN
ncbi:MAG: 16S rRNA (uracil(1498)-N(3))-methyltransferase [Pontiellaceae bacterium]|nr:16S rRNA (uracil(1498)-N(3))-methyltransferase [Pontiellaceae bacterium]